MATISALRAQPAKRWADISGSEPPTPLNICQPGLARSITAESAGSNADVGTATFNVRYSNRSEGRDWADMFGSEPPTPLNSMQPAVSRTQTLDSVARTISTAGVLADESTVYSMSDLSQPSTPAAGSTSSTSTIAQRALIVRPRRASWADLVDSQPATPASALTPNIRRSTSTTVRLAAEALQPLTLAAPAPAAAPRKMWADITDFEPVTPALSRVVSGAHPGAASAPLRPGLHRAVTVAVGADPSPVTVVPARPASVALRRSVTEPLPSVSERDHSPSPSSHDSEPEEEHGLEDDETTSNRFFMDDADGSPIAVPRPDRIKRASSVEFAQKWSEVPCTPSGINKNVAVMPESKPRIGIDIGGVLTRRPNDIESDLKWTESYAAPGAVEAVAKIVGIFGAEHVFLVSKVRLGSSMQQKSEFWLHNTMQFCERTGLLKDHIIFCPDRTGPEGKGPIAERLRLSHFVDDKLEVLEAVFCDDAGNSRQFIQQHHGLLFHFAQGGAADRPPRLYTSLPDDFRMHYRGVANWSEVLEHLDPASAKEKAELAMLLFSGALSSGSTGKERPKLQLKKRSSALGPAGGYANTTEVSAKIFGGQSKLDNNRSSDDSMSSDVAEKPSQQPGLKREVSIEKALPVEKSGTPSLPAVPSTAPALAPALASSMPPTGVSTMPTAAPMMMWPGAAPAAGPMMWPGAAMPTIGAPAAVQMMPMLVPTGQVLNYLQATPGAYVVGMPMAVPGQATPSAPVPVVGASPEATTAQSKS